MTENVKPIDPRVLDKVYRYCAYQDRCTSEVREKLKKLDLSGPEIGSVIQQLKDEGYLDDERYVEAYVRGKLRIKKWGKLKIKLKLKEKGLQDALINREMDNIEDDFYVKQLADLLEVKLHSIQRTGNHRDKLFRYAVQKGYEQGLVIDQLNTMNCNVEEA